MNAQEVVAREARLSRPAGIAALLAVALVIASFIVASGVGGGDGESELLRNVDQHSGTQILSSVIQAIGVALLAIPLYVLFTAARLRTNRMRSQLVGVVVAGPLFLGVAAILVGLANVDAADQFVSNDIPQLEKEGVGLDSDKADDRASDTASDASLRSLAVGFGLGGQIGIAVGMFYTALWGMRVGLLTRFWGSLGMALGAVNFLFFQFTILWFIYLGLLLLGWIPKGRPPAWQSGEAEPWPTPGEQAAAKVDGDAEEDPSKALPEAGGEDDPPRKRKSRD